MRYALRLVRNVLAEWIGLTVPKAWARLLRWLRRDRHAKHGTLAPVIVTPQGDIVPSLRQVPIRSTKADAKRQVPLRSTKADAKRQALAWARSHWNDPDLSWGQARKRIKRLEGRIRNGHLDGKAAQALAAVSEDA